MSDETANNSYQLPTGAAMQLFEEVQQESDKRQLHG
jgi:hypothetical protein